jgi:hypothetical protein
VPGRSPRPGRDASNVVGAGAAGGGIGTIVAAMANALPQGSPWKPPLIVSAPLIAIFISGSSLFVKTAFVDPFFRNRKDKATIAAMDAMLDDARSKKSEVMNDPHASNEHKRAVVRHVEQLEETRIKNISRRMEILAFEEL